VFAEGLPEFAVVLEVMMVALAAVSGQENGAARERSFERVFAGDFFTLGVLGPVESWAWRLLMAARSSDMEILAPTRAGAPAEYR
jgi:hypothetical protein